MDSGTERKITREQKKQFGVFYTPPSISRILCDWAISEPSEKILEPSFGGCGFLEASRDRLIELGSMNPNRQLFGCDVDRDAFHYLAKKIGSVDILGRFALSDFLKLTPEHFSTSEFDVVIGNPPYVSIHNMSEAQKKAASLAMENGGFSVSTKASLWAYFLMHSMQFLKTGGRMAWVLPGSFLHTDYAIAIRSTLSLSFNRILAISLGERMFESEGTDEHTVLLLCEEFKQGPAKNGIELDYADQKSSLKISVQKWGNGVSSPNTFDGKFGLAMMTPEISDFYKTISETKTVVKFGDIAKILIGIVTGDNKYFVINKEDIKKHRLASSCLRFILAKFGMSSGLSFKNDDITKLSKDNARCMLLDTSRMRKTSRALLDYLSTYPEEKKLTNRTFKKRSLWHRPDYGSLPDAFFPYMHHYGPRLVLNDAKVTSTNTIHRVYFKSIPEYKKKLAAISMLTTFSQVSAEIEGRCYGSGVLKHEPSEVKQILMMMPDDIGAKEVNRIYAQIDQLLRANKLDEARIMADQFILNKPIEQYGPKLLNVLNNALLDLRAKRHKTRVN